MQESEANDARGEEVAARALAGLLPPLLRALALVELAHATCIRPRWLRSLRSSSRTAAR